MWKYLKRLLLTIKENLHYHCTSAKSEVKDFSWRMTQVKTQGESDIFQIELEVYRNKQWNGRVKYELATVLIRLNVVRLQLPPGVLHYD